jgi:diguanylate cyclase (GGDEF)-like protein
MLRRVAASSLHSLQLIGVGLACFITADLINGYQQLHAAYAGGDLVDGVWIGAIALWAIAGSGQATPRRDDEPEPWSPRGRAVWAPYIAVAVSFGLLAYINRHEPVLPDLVLLGAAAACVTLVAIRQYVTQRELLSTHRRVAHQSLHDSLTGLPNRALVLDRAEQLLSRARRSGRPMAALYVDLDGFKHVNDSFGHAAGDELLRVIATRLTSVVRDDDTVGRLAGDEFVVLLDGTTLDVAPELVAERICEQLTRPARLSEAGGREMSVTASIGIALGSLETAEVLLRDADVAMYASKYAGRGRWSLFDSALATAARERVELEMDLWDAVANGELHLRYQPILDLNTDRVCGAEALVRWDHPRRGRISPAAFISLAEENGSIREIGRWVLQTACAQAAAWRSEGQALRISVNVSTRQLEDPDFAAEVARTAAAANLETDQLTLEITETALMRDPDTAAERLAELKALGVRIAIDDFGVGYSSLGYLLRFPVDQLKIDRSFIAMMGSSAQSHALVRTLIDLGEMLGLQTLAEGIEDSVQLARLREERCQLGQGYLFARPMEPQAFAEWRDGRRVGDPSAHQ